ncbi:MAG: C13 family peptidase [Bacteroidota bacterium]
MTKIFSKIKKDAEERSLLKNDGNQDFALYLDHKTFKKGNKIDIITEKIEFDQPTNVVFVDDEPGKNFGHRCTYFLYNAETGKYLKKVAASFPYFLEEKPDTIEIFRSSKTTERYIRKKKIKVTLEPGKLSAYRKLAPFPLRFSVMGKRYAILYSGGSNGRHVNDLEFLYRTLIDVYGFDPADIFVLNYDGTVNYTPAVWSSGWTEPPATSGFGPDGSAWRMVVNGRGDRAAFQSVMTTLQSRIQSHDCLFIHTNNHGWYDGSGGFVSAYGSPNKYYASDFAADLATLPAFKNLLVVMEQCASGSFAVPILGSTPATNTVFQAAVPGNESSWGGWPFDPWAELWISAMAGVRGDGSALAVSPDDNLDSLISSWEAYDYALSEDNPVISESSSNISESVFLSRCRSSVKHLKEIKEPKEFKEIKEPKEIKEFKEPKEFKEFKEPKEWFEPKIVFEPKQISDPKQLMEPKQYYEGPGWKPDDIIRWPHEELLGRIERLEGIVGELKPFIRKEERPEIKMKPKRKPKK